MSPVSMSSCVFRPWRIVSIGGMLFLGLSIWTFWYAMNSDKDDIHPLLTQLIPAGHCACQTSTVFECSKCLNPQCPVELHGSASKWEFEYGKDDRNEGLTEEQCDAAFPGLFEDLHYSGKYWRAAGNITRSSLDQMEHTNGLTRAMILNGHLFIIKTKSKGEDHRRKIVATLSSIHRALVSYPDHKSIPTIEFMFSVEDKADDVSASTHPLWVLARRPSEESLWLMPDFGFWAWDNIIYDSNNELGPYDEIVDKARDVERNLPFAQKEPKLVWRGKLSFAPKLRRTLLDRSRGYEWSDVKEVNWNVRQNYLKMEDHCKYQFVAHAEGRSYSASLKYRQACHSVLVIHKLQYIQHHHYLLVSSGPQQNFVEVERDFSDLSEKMDYLLANPADSQRIADNSIKTFREQYLTPAAEACYWRALWRAYASVSERAVLPETGTKRGLRYETFLLLSSKDMMDFAAG